MTVGVDVITSPANTVGEMSGGYDLVIRNTLGNIVEANAEASIKRLPIRLGRSRIVATSNPGTPYAAITPTVVGRVPKVIATDLPVPKGVKI